MTARYDWTINQGETSSLTYTRTDSGGSAVNFPAGTTFRMQAKDKYGGTAVVTLDNTAFNHSSGTNTFDVTISATETAAITAPAKYVYDIEAVDGSSVTRVLEGALVVRPEVTT
ncbi:MAG: DUF7264 domain-containing protein [Ilumatobacteraceae bacterium]